MAKKLRRTGLKSYDIDSLGGGVLELGAINADGYQFVVFDGVARYAFGDDNHFKPHVFYRAGADDKSTELPASVIGKGFTPVTLTPDGKQLYSLGNPSGGPDEFAISNLDGSGRKMLASPIRA